MLAKSSRKTGGIVLAASLSALSIGATANAQEGFEFNKYRIEVDDCPGCSKPTLYTEQDAIDYLADMRRILADGDDGGAPLYGFFDDDDDDDDDEPQVVYIDFDAGQNEVNGDQFPVCFTDGTIFGIFDDHIYTPEERANILDRIRADYADYNYVITDQIPGRGEFTTLTIGDDAKPLDCSEGSNVSVTPTGGLSILFGRAEKIDFRNADKGDDAFADASFWEFAAQFNPAFFESVSGLSIADFGSLEAAVSEAVTNQTSNTGAHEVGHLQGLRHQNSFGPPGSGIPDTGAILPEDFVPIFDGPGEASETVLHTMASGASVGLSLQGSTITDRFFSERSSIRIAFAEEGKSVSESRIRRGRIVLSRLDVENTIMEGVNAGADLQVRALTIDGSIDNVGEVDNFLFNGVAGDMINVELTSVIGRDLSFEEGIIGQVRLYKVNRSGEDTLVASNLQSFESVFDAEIFDALLWENGLYRIEISAPDEFFPFVPDSQDPFPLTLAGGGDLLTGQYSAFIYSFRADFDEDDDEDEDD